MTAIKTIETPTTTTRRANILLVDDDPIILDSLSEFLALEGHRVCCVNNFRQAMNRLAGGSFELMISDINMPGTNGMELLKLVRSKYPSTVVVMRRL